MSKSLAAGPNLADPLWAPDHTQLPEKDGKFVNNYHEHPQSDLLTGSALPRLHELRPDGQLSIGQDSGIYWKFTNPPLEGCKAPDWFLVLGVPPMLDGVVRRSYVLWKEGVRPLIVVEYVSGDGTEEHDTTPETGKFWVYEQCIAAPFYCIYSFEKATIELYALNGGGYRPVAPNEAGRYPIPPLGLELGIWQGRYRDHELAWLRWWDSATGEMLPTAEERAWSAQSRAVTAESLLDDTRQLLQEEAERAEQDRKRAEQEKRRAEQEEQRAELEKQRAEKEHKRAEQEEQRAEKEHKRAEQEEQRAEKESRRAEQEEQRAEKEHNRAEQEEQRAEKERRRAEQEKRRAEEAQRRAAALAEKLRALGVDPDAA